MEDKRRWATEWGRGGGQGGKGLGWVNFSDDVAVS